MSKKNTSLVPVTSVPATPAPPVLDPNKSEGWLYTAEQMRTILRRSLGVSDAELKKTAPTDPAVRRMYQAYMRTLNSDDAAFEALPTNANITDISSDIRTAQKRKLLPAAEEQVLKNTDTATTRSTKALSSVVTQTAPTAKNVLLAKEREARKVIRSAADILKDSANF